MPRYFFHMHNGSLSTDDEGLDFPDLNGARREAIRACGEMLCEVPAAIYNGDTMRVWVTDQPDGHGTVLFSLNVSDC
jgi:Domain of unknown function (DUF6894)